MSKHVLRTKLHWTMHSMVKWPYRGLVWRLEDNININISINIIINIIKMTVKEYVVMMMTGNKLAEERIYDQLSY